MPATQFDRVLGSISRTFDADAACAWAAARLLEFVRDRSGNAKMEYALLTALVSMVAVVSLDSMGAIISDWFFAVSGGITDAAATTEWVTS